MSGPDRGLQDGARRAELRVSTVGGLTGSAGGELPGSAAGLTADLTDPAAGELLGELAGDLTGPLTAQQRRLWFLDRLEPGDPAYHISTTVLLRGDLDADRLARAFDTVVARHESLRTRFVEVGGEPVQEVLPPAATPVLRADVPDEEAARRAVRELIRAPFDLAAGRLVRIGLFRLDADRHVLCTVAHHIVGDGWSLNLLFRQASDVYRGVEPTAPAMRYLDYARTHQDEDEAALAYWRTALAEAPVLELPPDRPRPARRTSAGVSASRVFDDGVWTSVQVLARELRCTPFMVLMTVYQLMLAQVSGQDDVCVGTPLAGRDEVAAESVFGYFVRMLVLRGDLSGDVTFRELVRRTRTACLGAFTHPWLPFEQLVADSAAPRDPSRNPLFQAAFTLHTTMDVSANGFESFEGVAVEGFGEGSRSTVTDVAMDVFVSSTAINARADQDRMEVVLTASADLFDAHGAERLADRFADVLRIVLADPDARVRELPLVDDAERAELLRIGTGPALDVGLGLLDRIELVAALTPDAVAVDVGRGGQSDDGGLGGGEHDGGLGDGERSGGFGGGKHGGGHGGSERSGSLGGGENGGGHGNGERSGSLGGSEHGGGLGGGEQLTYGQLWASSGKLADTLRAAGVGTGHLVGVSLPRGAEQIVALLAIWRCGAGYVPFDPALPEQRLGMLMAQAGVAAMITPEGARQVAGMPTIATDPAYVVFTSGSTGVPKPVLVGRTAVAERVAWMVPAYELTAADRVVQFAELGFDTHAEEVWPALSAGATLVLLPEGPRSLPEVLAADPAITVLDLPTAYWQALLDLDPAWPPALRLVILGGEQVDATAIGRWRNAHGDRVRLVNTYGPSEATIIATATDLTAADTDGEFARRPPIGRPIGDVRAYVLDAADRLVPRGTPGELCLAGAGLADGYLGRSDLTAERFTADPYGSGLMYRTGDRARWRRDEPVLEFLGRLDRQLKVRGVRIEPGEVEAVLSGHPDVGQVVVTAFGDSLIAYVTGTAAVDGVRAHAAERLPALLVPSVVVPLAELPLTTHGKVDIAALPVPAADDAVKAVFEPTRTEAEELVALIFTELLPVERVGVHDDFFVLGGHSLLAIRVIARVRAVVGLDLPVRLLFEQPTVAGFAEAVEAALFAEIDQLTEEEAEAQLATRMEAG